ncbi:MAG: SAM-dependent methyltransferase [Lachnospiraceae bacterium]|nr:SAM-dependent methyltransferase [Lachnospiraceae bacterium]
MEIKLEEIYDDALLREVKESLEAKLLRAIISNPRQKDGISKIKIRPVMLEGTMHYQVTEYIGTQVFHKNMEENELVSYICDRISRSFKQCEITTGEFVLHILVSKKGKITMNRKMTKAVQIQPEQFTHNRTKNYILKEGIAVPFLVDLGVMNRQGMVIKQKYDKFKQINRFLEFIQDIKANLPKDREISIIDFGCGKSYLTFAMYYYLHDLCGLDVRITGLDLKTDVIQNCNRLSQAYGYDKLVFKMGDIAEYNEQNQVDMVVTLHACDTATDYALYKAVNWGARVILSVPCCQHELNRQIENELLKPVFSYGILKERMAAILTDAIRAEVLKTKGYKTEILEFIDMEHTPKNLLIRAVRCTEKAGADKEALDRLVAEFGAKPTIIKLFE